MNTQAHAFHPVRWLAAVLSVLVMTTITTQAATTEVIEKTLTADPGGTLVIKVKRGSLDVTGQPGSAVEIAIKREITASSKEAEETFLTENPVVIEQNGNEITITREGASGGGGGWFSKDAKEKAEYVITVPAQFHVKLNTAGGPITTANLEGNTRLNTSGGTIAMSDLRGTIQANTSGGSIRLSNCHGGTIVNTSGGSIKAENGSGDLKLNTSGGSITVDAHDGNVNGRTSGGSIKVIMLSQPTAPCTLATSGGSVTAMLPADAAVDIDASTSGGSVSSSFPDAQVDPKKKTRLVAPVNGGGPTLKLRTSGGNVSIKQL
jgi:hypothetical protein